MPLTVLLPLFAMYTAAGVALVVGALFFTKASGEPRANRVYGAWLVLGGLTQLHFALDFGGYFLDYPALKFLPLYFSLWLPVMLFGYVKISLYPRYRLRLTDLKHLLLPIGQTIYFLCVWLFPELRHEEGRYFWNPFYGAMEQALFLAGWPLYALFSVLYLRQRRRQLAGRMLPRIWWYTRKLIKGVGLFVFAYGTLAIVDYLAYRYFLADLRSRSWYAGAQALSFTVLLVWITVYGAQVLVWGRKLRV